MGKFAVNVTITFLTEMFICKTSINYKLFCLIEFVKNDFQQLPADESRLFEIFEIILRNPNQNCNLNNHSENGLFPTNNN